MSSCTSLFVVDDDPTGAQGQQDVPLLLGWTAGLLETALRDEPRAIHVLTNSRALTGEEAFAVVRNAARAIRAAVGEPQLVLRGDSTLRGHLLPEYRAVCDTLARGREPPLLLVPALPAAGRVTVGGRHWLVRADTRIPIAESEFAQDAAFGYRSSRLLDWADERSGGFFPAALGTEVELGVVRRPGGSDRVADALRAAAALPVPTVVAPDAETEDDLQVIAEGLRRAWRSDPGIVVRCAPAFASALSGATAASSPPLPHVGRGLLVVIGSHVPLSSQQLATLAERRPASVVEVDPLALGADGAALVDRVARRARELLARDRLAIVATAREVAPDAGFGGGMRVARALAAIVERLCDASDVLLSKGGITSAVNVREGLHAERAFVVGPVVPGVSLWQAYVDGEGARPVIVFPGNVGSPSTLADLVDRLLEA